MTTTTGARHAHAHDTPSCVACDSTCGLTRSFERYCADIEHTAVWGGQPELLALSHVLRRRITVFSAHLPTLEMGEEYGGGAAPPPPLRVAYQRHAFGLGEHYNSVALAQAAQE